MLSVFLRSVISDLVKEEDEVKAGRLVTMPSSGTKFIPRLQIIRVALCAIVGIAILFSVVMLFGTPILVALFTGALVFTLLCGVFVGNGLKKIPRKYKAILSYAGERHDILLPEGYAFVPFYGLLYELTLIYYEPLDGDVGPVEVRTNSGVPVLMEKSQISILPPDDPKEAREYDTLGGRAAVIPTINQPYQTWMQKLAQSQELGFYDPDEMQSDRLPTMDGWVKALVDPSQLTPVNCGEISTAVLLRYFDQRLENFSTASQKAPLRLQVREWGPVNQDNIPKEGGVPQENWWQNIPSEKWWEQLEKKLVPHSPEWNRVRAAIKMRCAELDAVEHRRVMPPGSNSAGKYLKVSAVHGLLVQFAIGKYAADAAWLAARKQKPIEDEQARSEAREWLFVQEALTGQKGKEAERAFLTAFPHASDRKEIFQFERSGKRLTRDIKQISIDLSPAGIEALKKIIEEAGPHAKEFAGALLAAVEALKSSKGGKTS